MDSQETRTLSVGVFVRNAVTYAALTFQVYDWLTSLSFEVRDIWRKPWHNLAKWQYLYSRYAGMILQLSNAFFYTCFRHTYSVQPLVQPPLHMCRNWKASQIIGVQSLMLCLQISLAHRVIALYNRRTWVIILLTGLVVAEYSSSIIWGYFTIRQFEMDGPCVVKKPPSTFAYVGIIHMFAQCAIWWLTAFKCTRARLRILAVIIRDGSYALGAMLVVFGALIGNTFLSSLQAHREFISQTLIPTRILTLIYATVNCRTIANVENIVKDAGGRTSVVELTSIVVSESQPEDPEEGRTSGSPSTIPGTNTDFQCQK